MKKNLLLSFLFLFIFVACSDSDSDPEPELPLQENLIYSNTIKITSDQFMQYYGTVSMNKDVYYTTLWYTSRFVEDELNLLEETLLLQEKSRTGNPTDPYYVVWFEYKIEGFDDEEEIEEFSISVYMGPEKKGGEEHPRISFGTPPIKRNKPSSEIEEHMNYYKRDYNVSIYAYEKYYEEEAKEFIKNLPD